MKDFTERLQAAFERGLEFRHSEEARVVVTEITDRYPFPVDETEARECKGAANVFAERYKGRVYCAVQVFYSDEYKKAHDTHDVVHPIPQTCNVILRTLGLGSMGLGSCEWDYDKMEFPILKTDEVYGHLPPTTQPHEH